MVLADLRPRDLSDDWVVLDRVWTYQVKTSARATDSKTYCVVYVVWDIDADHFGLIGVFARTSTDSDGNEQYEVINQIGPFVTAEAGDHKVFFEMLKGTAEGRLVRVRSDEEGVEHDSGPRPFRKREPRHPHYGYTLKLARQNYGDDT